jgi:hypothetical protein
LVAELLRCLEVVKYASWMYLLESAGEEEEQTLDSALGYMLARENHMHYVVADTSGKHRRLE